MVADKTRTACNQDLLHGQGKPIIAAFDFDGTLTYRDTLPFFLLYAYGILKTLSLLMLKVPSLLLYTLGRIPRQEFKERVLTTYFSGESHETLQRWGKSFANGTLDKHLRLEGMKRLKWHQEKGHRCILISASLDIYIYPWAKKYGFNDALCTSLATTDQGVVTGKLNGGNCWGAEKTRRLEALLGPKENYTLYAYGNSRGDRELLELADFPYYKKFN